MAMSYSMNTPVEMLKEIIVKCDFALSRAATKTLNEKGMKR